MKKILLLATVFCLLTTSSFAEDVVDLNTQDFIPNILAISNSQTVTEADINKFKFESGAVHSESLKTESAQNTETVHHYKFYDELARTAHDVYNLQIENTNVPACLLQKPLTHEFKNGPLESIHTWGVLQLNNTTTIPENGGGNDKFNVNLINIMIDGKFRGGKEDFRIMFDPTSQHKRGFTHQLIQDLYIETHRLPNHVILLGNSRVGGGIEGSQSAYTLPFLNRAQISRNLGNSRKFGLRIKGNYALVDYDFGGYSSDTFLSEFFPGVEFNGMLNLKPLGLTDGRYGKLRTGGGIISGQNHSRDYFVATAYLGYEYKKFWTRMEYANSNGSNGGDGFCTKKRQGWHVTLGYHLNKKWELLARYDEFDPDKTISANNQREYSFGVNYYIKGQALRLLMNYVYCQNENKPDSHRIIVGTQIAI